MFSEATKPHSEQVVSPLISSESQEVLPQILHDSEMDSVRLLLEGLELEEIFLPPPSPETTFPAVEMLVALFILTTSGCIVIFTVFKQL